MPSPAILRSWPTVGRHSESAVVFLSFSLLDGWKGKERKEGKRKEKESLRSGVLAGPCPKSELSEAPSLSIPDLANSPAVRGPNFKPDPYRHLQVSALLAPATRRGASRQ
eukprot:scaffold179225_cov17-Tisochrysis_lutea.AAC.1